MGSGGGGRDEGVTKKEALHWCASCMSLLTDQRQVFPVAGLDTGEWRRRQLVKYRPAAEIVSRATSSQSRS